MTPVFSLTRFLPDPELTPLVSIITGKPIDWKPLNTKQPSDSSEGCSRVNGGARTHDNQNHNLALYQLNYAHHV